MPAEPVWRAFATTEAGLVRLESRGDGMVFMTWLSATQAQRVGRELLQSAAALGIGGAGAATNAAASAGGAAA